MQDTHRDGLSAAVQARMTWPSNSEVLDFYEGIFDAAYVCLLPFIRPGRLSPLRFRTADYPSSEELLREAQPLAWADVLTLTGLASLDRLDRVLLAESHALPQSVAQPDDVARLRQVCDLEHPQVISPRSGHLSPFLTAPLVDVFLALGHDTVWVDDGTGPCSWATQALRSTAATGVAGAFSIYSNDASLLWVQHWDSNHALLCGRQADLLRLQISKWLEGFYCNASTKVNWSLE